MIERLPASWKTDVVLISGGGRDDDGNIISSTETTLTGCLIAPRRTEDPVDRSEIVVGEAVLFVPLGATASIPSSARIRVPQGAALPGLWSVDGQAVRWPYGFEVPLRKE